MKRLGRPSRPRRPPGDSGGRLCDRRLRNSLLRPLPPPLLLLRHLQQHN